MAVGVAAALAAQQAGTLGVGLRCALSAAASAPQAVTSCCLWPPAAARAPRCMHASAPAAPRSRSAAAQQAPSPLTPAAPRFKFKTRHLPL